MAYDRQGNDSLEMIRIYLRQRLLGLTLLSADKCWRSHQCFQIMGPGVRFTFTWDRLIFIMGLYCEGGIFILNRPPGLGPAYVRDCLLSANATPLSGSVPNAALDMIIQSVYCEFWFRIRLLLSTQHFITDWRDHSAYGSTSTINVMHNILKTMIQYLSHSMDTRDAPIRLM